MFNIYYMMCVYMARPAAIIGRHYIYLLTIIKDILTVIILHTIIN